MIPNLKDKLKSLPKTEIKKEQAPVRGFDCSVYVKEFDVDEGSLLSEFVESSVFHLKTACKITDAADIRPEDIVFFDTETTGLAGGAGTVAFLVGVGRLEGEKFVVRQFFMNDYHQEPSVLNEFAASLDGAKAVATYNGKSFDAPLIKTRSIINRISLELDKYTHFDLLHACRRLYKMRLSRMKLTDVEENILGIVREDDIPGSEIPEIFFRYLKYGEKQLLDKVMEHNMTDIVSLAKISAKLAGAYAAPYEMEHAEEKYCIARTLCQLDMYLPAQEIYEQIKDDIFEAKADLGYLKRRMGDYKTAVILFDELAQTSRFEIKYDIEAAKIMEHRLRNYEQALNYAMRAKEKAFNNRLLGRSLDIIDDVELRISRIKSKLEGEN